MEHKPQKGLARVRQIYENRDSRVRELKAEGEKIIGYFCIYTPLEMITAAEWVPYRIFGDVNEPISEADVYLETILCSFVRSCFDIGIKGRYSFLDGLVVPHSCDSVEKIYEIWRYYLKPRYSHFIDVPHMVHPASFKFFKAELGTYKRTIEKACGMDISNDLLRQHIKLHNEQRALVRELYELRKPDPPLVSGSEVIQTLVAVMSMPVEEGSDLLRSVIEEIKGRKDHPPKKNARVLVWGAPVDATPFVQLIEDCGANVAMDDICVGSRPYWRDVELTDDPLDGMVDYYLDKLRCPRTYREKVGPHKEDLENRFRYLLDYAKEFSVNGVILAVIRYCDTHEYEAPDVRDYLKEAGLPVLHIEHDYSVSALEPFRTRIQAFIEMIG